MLNNELLQRVMESNQTPTDELYQQAMEGAAAIATVRDIAREEGEVAAISEFCDSCCYLKLLPDPDPYDWFRDNDMKAVCTEVNGLIACSLERPSEWTNIRKPLYCPKLGRELSEEEKKQAAENLKWAQNALKLSR